MFVFVVVGDAVDVTVVVGLTGGNFLPVPTVGGFAVVAVVVVVVDATVEAAGADTTGGSPAVCVGDGGGKGCVATVVSWSFFAPDVFIKNTMPRTHAAARRTTIAPSNPRDARGCETGTTDEGELGTG